MRRTTRIRLPLGDRILLGLFKYLVYVQAILLDTPLTAHFQAELAVNTHMLVVDIHRSALRREGDVGQHQAVSVFLLAENTTLITLRPEPGQ